MRSPVALVLRRVLAWLVWLAEAFHQSEARGRDVGLETAVESYVDNVLRQVPAEPETDRYNEVP